jgi:hypothetical protein
VCEQFIEVEDKAEPGQTVLRVIPDESEAVELLRESRGKFSSPRSTARRNPFKLL